MKPDKLSTEFYDYTIKKVSKTGNSGHVILPKEWIGKRVKVLLIEPVNEKGID